MSRKSEKESVWVDVALACFFALAMIGAFQIGCWLYAGVGWVITLDSRVQRLEWRVLP